MLIWALLTAIVVLVLIVCWLLRPESRVRSGEVDFVPAAARGELDFDWPLVNTERHAHPGTWCSPDYCGSERRPLHRQPRQPLSKAS